MVPRGIIQPQVGLLQDRQIYPLNRFRPYRCDLDNLHDTDFDSGGQALWFHRQHHYGASDWETEF